MPMPDQPWRAALQPASFRGAGFHVEVSGQAGGRRNANHEFPKRDTPFDEDMGRRGRRWPVTAYIVGPNYLSGRDALIQACEAAGSGTLVHPTLGSLTVNCDTYAMSETRERGGICTFEMNFLEAGSLDSGVSADTQAQASSAGQDLGQTSADSAQAAIDNTNSDVPQPVPRPADIDNIST